MGKRKGEQGDVKKLQKEFVESPHVRAHMDALQQVWKEDADVERTAKLDKLLQPIGLDANFAQAMVHSLAGLLLPTKAARKKHMAIADIRLAQFACNYGVSVATKKAADAKKANEGPPFEPAKKSP